LFCIQKIKILIFDSKIKKTRINPDYSQIFSFVKKLRFFIAKFILIPPDKKSPQSEAQKPLQSEMLDSMMDYTSPFQEIQSSLSLLKLFVPILAVSNQILTLIL